MVVVTGCANNISKQIAAKPLNRYTYMLGVATAFVYLPLYGAVMLSLLWSRVVPRYQLSFIWKSTGQRFPIVLYFVIAALGDTLGDVIGMICTPYVSGPVHSLLSNCTVLFIAVLSICVLFKRYSLLQCASLVGVFGAVVIGVLPSFMKGESSASTSAFFATVLGVSCIFNAISFIVKELMFKRYREWQTVENLQDDAGGLHVFMVNTHAALFQLPLTILTVPLNQLLGQTHGEDIVSYMHEAFHCIFTNRPGACGPEGDHAETAGLCMVIYVIFNVAWNICVIASVKHSGALSTFVALKAIFPLSTILFAYVDWPLLGPTELHWLVWLSVILLLPCIAVFWWASQHQEMRAERHPSLATCCWPLGKSSRPVPPPSPLSTPNDAALLGG